MEGLDRMCGGGQFVQDIRTLLLVGASVGELDRDETVTLVELSGADVLLERIEPNRRRCSGQRMSQEFGTDALPDMRGMNVQLLHPTATFLHRDRDNADDDARSDCDGCLAAGKKNIAYPVPDFRVGVCRRGKRHKRSARFKEYRRNAVCVGGLSLAQEELHAV